MTQPLPEQLAPIEVYPGSPLQARRELQRRHVVTAATAVFIARGYHTATMAEIAQRAGYSKPVLYQQFSGKLELYHAVLQVCIDSLTGSLQQSLCTITPGRDRLRAAVQAYFDFVDDEAQGFRLVFDADVHSEPSVQLRVGQAINACIDAIARAVAHDGKFSWHQARLVAVGLAGASQLVARDWLETGRPLAKAEAIETVVTLCWVGLSPVPLRPGAFRDVSR